MALDCISDNGVREKGGGGELMESFFVEMFLIFVAPVLGAFVAVGSAGKKLGWYLGTVAAVFAANILTGAAFLGQIRVGVTSDTSIETLLEWAAMLAANVAMTTLAANTGKRCPHCMSRIHPKARRCPHCQADTQFVRSSVQPEVPTGSDKRES
jgi:hypothetical protein